MNTTTAAFYLLAWIFAVQHPDGKVGEGAIHFANKFSKLECNSKATEFAMQNPMEAMQAKGDKPVYSRFVCVPVVMER